MNVQENLDFARIAEAIEYIRDNFKSQPTLDDVANKIFTADHCPY
jgi:AraC family transcriptional regulator of adaptative response/methylated-DNA-[protein]-cysteine methyltransferase